MLSNILRRIKLYLINFKTEETVDPIPTEELKIEKHDERNKKKTKNESSTENKYKRN